MRRAVSFCVAIGLAAPAYADDPPPRPTPFDQGRISISGGASQETNFGYKYVSVGVGGAYYVLPGLAVELAGSHEFGGGPSISELTPGLRYVAQPLVRESPVVPYVGGFYRHWFVGGGIADVDTVGARAGAIYVSGKLILGLGVVYEHQVSACTMDCDSWYPDFILGVAL